MQLGAMHRLLALAGDCSGSMWLLLATLGSNAGNT
jgi:hypothetical protein